MNEEFYEFLYHLRSSGFTHNTRENTKMIFYRNSQPVSQKTPFVLEGNQYGEITGNNMTGEMSSFSYDPAVNFRNTIIGVAFALNMHALDKCIDLETAGALSDFYIQKAEAVSTAAEFTRVMQEMCADFDELSHKKAWQSYGQPIDTCIDLVYQNLYSRFTVKDIAVKLKYDESYLSSLFKEHTGQTLYAFIKAAKLQEARVLLLHTSQSLTEIASALGYHSLSHFSKVFKMAEGVSPTQYRKAGEKEKSFKFYGDSFLTKSEKAVDLV